MPETEGSALVDTSPSLAEFVGGMYGDIPSTEPEPDAGPPPDAVPDDATEQLEGDAASEPAGDTPAEADPNATPDTQAETSDEPDPLDGATPFGYVVDGQPKTLDGITVLRDGAGIIEPEAVKQLQQIVSKHDHLLEQGRRDYERYSALERATAWQTRDA